MNCSCLSSTVGKKMAMAVTGLILYGFVVMHMIGNLKVFMGVNAETGHYKIDEYAEFLRAMGHELFGHTTVLWITRVVLLVAVLIHVTLALQLNAANKRARPVGYKKFEPKAGSVASRTMLFSGLFLLAFIVYHILHFTTGTLHMHGFQHGAVHANMSSAFAVTWVAGIYFIAVALLGFHLYHGVWSLFQTLGIHTPERSKPIKALAALSGLGLFLGFASVPVSFYLGIV